MQSIVMIEMLRAAAKFQPNGQPLDPAHAHRMAFLAERNQKRARALRRVWRTLRAKLVQILAEFHFNNRSQKEIT
jgi:hypothetical protein